MTKLFAEDTPLILELLETLTLKEVAQKFEVTPASISRVLAKEGTTTARIKFNYRRKHVVGALTEGKDMMEIAIELNMARSALYSSHGAKVRNSASNAKA